MALSSADIVIVGGGIAGMTAAYYLAKSGVPSVVVERDAIGSHASGFAYGGLSPLSGFGIPGPMAEIALDGMRLHRELSKSLLEETGIDVDFRVRSSLALAFTEADVRRLRATMPWQQQAVCCATCASAIAGNIFRSAAPISSRAGTGARSACGATAGASPVWSWSGRC
jgi:glycine/D-amino acid oxidase-like deaminating enzyme